MRSLQNLKINRGIVICEISLCGHWSGVPYTWRSRTMSWGRRRGMMRMKPLAGMCETLETTGTRVANYDVLQLHLNEQTWDLVACPWTRPGSGSEGESGCCRFLFVFSNICRFRARSEQEAIVTRDAFCLRESGSRRTYESNAPISLGDTLDLLNRLKMSRD